VPYKQNTKTELHNTNENSEAEGVRK